MAIIKSDSLRSTMSGVRAGCTDSSTIVDNCGFFSMICLSEFDNESDFFFLFLEQ